MAFRRGDFVRTIALRYLRSKRSIGLVSLISYISIVGITIGVAALIVVLSVFNGFNSFAIEQLVGFDPHIRITPRSTTTVNGDSLIESLSLPDGSTASPFIEGRTAVIHDDVTQISLLKGVRPGSAGGVMGEKLERSRASVTADEEHASIILGSMLASRLNVGNGDEIAIVGREGLELALTQVAQPTTVPAVVVSTFTLNQEYDQLVSFISLQTARRLFDIENGEMGIEIRIDDYKRATEVAAAIERKIGEGYMVETWQDLHRDLYGAMELERWAAFAILLLIIIVAAFNVLGSLTMTVIEKQRDIGILMAMGADSGIVRSIFLSEGLLIGIIGTGAGSILGLAISFLQKEYSLVKLDTSRYLLAALPIQINPIDVLLVITAAMVLTTFAGFIPAHRASKIEPAEAVRWE